MSNRRAVTASRANVQRRPLDANVFRRFEARHYGTGSVTRKKRMQLLQLLKEDSGGAHVMSLDNWGYRSQRFSKLCNIFGLFLNKE